MRLPLLVAAGVFAAALVSTAAARDLDAARKSGKLRVVVWADNLPELYTTQASPNPGLEAELLQGFASLHGLTLEVVTVASLDVGTIPGSSWAEEVAAAGVPAAQVDGGFDSAASLVAGLRAGRVDAAVFSVVWALVEARRDPDLQTGTFVGAPTSVGFAVRRDEPQLKAALDAYVANVRRTPTWSRLVVKYFGEAGLEILKRSRE